MTHHPNQIFIVNKFWKFLFHYILNFFLRNPVHIMQIFSLVLNLIPSTHKFFASSLAIKQQSCIICFS
jgi:hypothetical protein